LIKFLFKNVSLRKPDFFHEQAAVDAKRLLKIKTYKDPPNTIEKYPKIITATTIKKT
jgi:hypothetical protein